jgi:hypothetical protein|tara:strand:- start:96 stop:1706 length:1611 start_codon:yes stop_codon:yes gene_type:complete
MASEDKDYEQSALGKRVNELMDDGYDFGEAVKQAMSEGLKDGGSVGIEILFGPKRDNFRYGGDTMGGKNDKSKSSPGPDSSKVSAQQQSNHQQAMAAAQNDGPSFKDKVKSVITNPATQVLGGAILTGGINLAVPGALDKLNKARMIKNAIDYARYVAPDEAIEGELENIQTKGGISPYADGGRVGFFMGGPALEGEALSIYNSMSAYGNDDQTIADRLQALGMYTPPGSTPDTPDTTSGQTYGLQSGSDNFSPYNPDPNKIQSFKTDSRIAAANEADIRNKQLTSMGIKDPFADEISLSGAYYGDMPTDTSNQIGKQSKFAKVTEGLRSIPGKVKGMMDNPLMNAIGFAVNPLVGGIKGIASFANRMLPANERAIQENIMGNLGFAVNDIGQIVSTGDYNDPENVMAGYNLNKMTVDTFKNRIAKIRNRKIAQTAASRARIAAIEEAQRKFELAEKLKADALLEAQLKKAQQEIAAKGYKDYGQGGADQATQDSYAGSDGSYAGASTEDYGGGEKDGGIIGYRNGGLATMFTRRR